MLVRHSGGTAPLNGDAASASLRLIGVAGSGGRLSHRSDATGGTPCRVTTYGLSLDDALATVLSRRSQRQIFLEPLIDALLRRRWHAVSLPVIEQSQTSRFPV